MQRPIPVLFSAQQISERIHGLASEIATSMPQEIVIIALLKGGFIFTADLIRALHRTGMRPQVDFMTLRSYGKGTESSGKIDILQDIHEEVAGRHVLIVDDILESGRTLVFCTQSAGITAGSKRENGSASGKARQAQSDGGCRFCRLHRPG